ncbi:MAG: hypothetical protein JWO94_3039 [Verrucomicrobiaceae bacterium]|nr:hypothetical protein [Verrucomicrobiaceae bacterium]
MISFIHMRFHCALSLAFLPLLMVLTSCEMPVGPTNAPGAGSPPGGGPFMLGIDVLASRNFDLLRGKRVGLITNHTAYTSRGEMTRVVMKRALGASLTTLYAPEHGIFGTEQAGKKVGDRRDPVTGLPVYSLHGDYRKPQPWMLKNIDVLVFDVQDIGCRSYTYISTMAVSMEAAAEAGKEFVVLDRPNPLGGLRVEGPPLDSRWKSFVGQIPVPYVHGMTTGELALMIAGRGWINHVPRVNVAKMQGWTRGMIWQDTGLRWHPTSPNIPHAMSPAYYVTTGILGSAACADVGIPWSGDPFTYAGASGVNPNAMAAAARSWGFPGVSFSPYQHGGDGGVRISISPRSTANLTALDIYLTAELTRVSHGKVASCLRGDELNLFHKVYGSASLYSDLRRGVSAASIVSSWQGSVNNFRAARQRYLLYP